jgi:hypothetical protein
MSKMRMFLLRILSGKSLVIINATIQNGSIILDVHQKGYIHNCHIDSVNPKIKVKKV